MTLGCNEAVASLPAATHDALAFNCTSHEFGLKESNTDKVCIVERWRRWQHDAPFFVEGSADIVTPFGSGARRA